MIDEFRRAPRRKVSENILVTDAMPSVGAASKSFVLQGKKITVKGGVCVDEHGTLAGSDLDMATAVRNLVRTIGVPPPDAFRRAAEVPAAFLRLEGEIGRIAPGFRASMALLDDDLTVRRTWIDGAEAVG